MIQQTKTDRERFVALSRICLNNWHYIDRKVLTLYQPEDSFLQRRNQLFHRALRQRKIDCD